MGCEGCQLGRASGVEAGLLCPFLTREEAPGTLLARAGQPVERVWYVRAGVVAASREDAGDPVEAPQQVHLPGSFVGLECLTHDRSQWTARALTRAVLCSATVEGFHSWLIQSGERFAFVDRLWRAWPAWRDRGGPVPAAPPR